MLAWLLSPKSHSPRFRPGARRFLTNLRFSIVPIDGDFWRIRPTADRDPETDDVAAGRARPEESASPTRDRAAHPPLPTHARNAVEEWIPASILYGPPW
ncbi:MAG: hypothetical protein ACREK5_00955 [Gemmatimonadota bacterium]